MKSNTAENNDDAENLLDASSLTPAEVSAQQKVKLAKKLVSVYKINKDKLQASSDLLTDDDHRDMVKRIGLFASKASALIKQHGLNQPHLENILSLLDRATELQGDLLMLIEISSSEAIAALPEIELDNIPEEAHPGEAVPLKQEAAVPVTQKAAADLQPNTQTTLDNNEQAATGNTQPAKRPSDEQATETPKNLAKLPTSKLRKKKIKTTTKIPKSSNEQPEDSKEIAERVGKAIKGVSKASAFLKGKIQSLPISTSRSLGVSQLLDKALKTKEKLSNSSKLSKTSAATPSKGKDNAPSGKSAIADQTFDFSEAKWDIDIVKEEYHELEMEPEGEGRLFNLNDQLYTSSNSANVDRKAPNLIEVLTLTKGNVSDIRHLEPGEKFEIKLGPKNITLAHNTKKAQLLFFRPEKMKGKVNERSGSQESTSPHIVDLQGEHRKEVFKAHIPETADIHIEMPHADYLVRALKPSAKTAIKPIVANQDITIAWKSVAASIILHLVIILIIGGLSLYFASQAKKPEPEFVTLDIKDLENPKKEPPKPKVKPKPKPKPKAEKPKPKPKVKPKPKPKPKLVNKPKVVKKPTPPPPKATVKKVDVKKTGLLATLGSRKSKKSTSKKILTDVTNLDAVRTTDNTKSALSVGGLKAKVNNSKMTLASGEIIDTKGGANALRTGGKDGKGIIGSLDAGKTGARNVQAMVTADVTKQVKVKGGMSREQVKKVIDEHMDEIVYCYEMAISTSPGLGGKAVFEWTIKTSGKVGTVGIKSSTVKSDYLHSCIKDSIKSWQFPKPKGSEVTVSYPFLFDTVGF